MSPISIGHIILCRTDNIGDVILSLPVAGYLKTNFPEIKISFLGKSYTRPIIEACRFIDDFIDREEVLVSKKLTADAILFLYLDKAIAQLAFSNNIRIRVGTANRWFHWFYVNKKIFFSRKKSDLHEAQLNFKLLEGIGMFHNPTLDEISNLYGLAAKKIEFSELKDTSRKHIILHPKSKGSAREWPMANYEALAHLLVSSGSEVWVTGTLPEGNLIKHQAPNLFDSPQIHDMTGVLTLDQLISFISLANGLVACSTGPLHVAAALGKIAVGLYPPRKPIHPGRWAAIGSQVEILVIDKNCVGCEPLGCSCIEAISVNKVFEKLKI